MDYRKAIKGNYREAIKGMYSIKEYFGLGINIECIDTAIYALEKADKYRWHDLRKDPTDLPKKAGEYNVSFEPNTIPIRLLFDTEYYRQFGTYSYMDVYGTGVYEECFEPSPIEVIAWQEIEYFEV